jgi:hypothetical protein
VKNQSEFGDTCWTILLRPMRARGNVYCFWWLRTDGTLHQSTTCKVVWRGNEYPLDRHVQEKPQICNQRAPEAPTTNHHAAVSRNWRLLFSNSSATATPLSTAVNLLRPVACGCKEYTWCALTANNDATNQIPEFHRFSSGRGAQSLTHMDSAFRIELGAYSQFDESRFKVLR